MIGRAVLAAALLGAAVAVVLHVLDGRERATFAKIAALVLGYLVVAAGAVAFVIVAE